jgi:hypothetical protein
MSADRNAPRRRASREANAHRSNRPDQPTRVQFAAAGQEPRCLGGHGRPKEAQASYLNDNRTRAR